MKRGQIQISFGMIFSIIIIIATVAIAFYVITYFLNLSDCTKVGMFWNSLNNEVDKAWNSDITQTIYKTTVSSGITSVCFGNFTQSVANEDKKIFTDLENYAASDKNAYLYPTGKACVAINNVQHARTNSFFCVPVKNGEISLRLSKTSSDALVELSKP